LYDVLDFVDDLAVEQVRYRVGSKRFLSKTLAKLTIEATAPTALPPSRLSRIPGCFYSTGGFDRRPGTEFNQDSRSLPATIFND
jgi:hypothetical protein